MSIASKKSFTLLVLTFVFALFTGSLHAVTKHEMYEVGKKIKEKQAIETKLYSELRKLNEEGGANAQEKAQLIMSEINEIKKEIKELESMMANISKDSRNNTNYKSARTHEAHRMYRGNN